MTSRHEARAAREDPDRAPATPPGGAPPPRQTSRGTRVVPNVTGRGFGQVRIRLTSATRGELRLPGQPGILSVHGVRRGRIVVRDAAALEVSTGEALLSTDASVRVALLRPSEIVSISIPVPEGEEAPDGVRLAAGDGTLLRGAMAFAAEVAAEPEQTPRRAPDPQIELMLRDMVARLLTAEAVHNAPNPVRLALAEIAQSYPDPTLSSRQVAAAVSISVRQLERQFRDAGTSIASEVRNTRIGAAVRLLSEDPTGARSVEQIAQRVGFSSASPLARAMQRLGMPTPSAFRLSERYPA